MLIDRARRSWRFCESSNVSDTEADEMKEHLRGLGYLE
jgi:hypothetical protein